MSDDAESLRRYAESASEEAFAALVKKHLDLVYSVALRHTGGDTHRAQDATQKVFVDLARKAKSLTGHPVLIGWLYQSAKFAAIDIMRSEWRRQAREQKAKIMSELTTTSGAAIELDSIRPMLDQAMSELSDRDRDAVLLRFFEGRAFADIGRAIHSTEDAARMRVERALEKMKASLSRCGVTSTTAALAMALAHQTTVAAPAGLAATVTGAAMAGAASSGGVLAFFTSLGTSKVAIPGIVAILATGFVIRETVTRHESEAANSSEHQGYDTGQMSAATPKKLDLPPLPANGNISGSHAMPPNLDWNITSPDMARNIVGEIFDLSKIDQLPVPILQPRPQHPPEMRRAGISGRVVVDFIVDTNGVVRNAHVVSSSQRAFEDAAVEAVGRWRFLPGMKGGHSVNTYMQVPIVFSLNTDK